MMEFFRDVERFERGAFWKEALHWLNDEDGFSEKAGWTKEKKAALTRACKRVEGFRPWNWKTVRQPDEEAFLRDGAVSRVHLPDSGCRCERLFQSILEAVQTGGAQVEYLCGRLYYRFILPKKGVHIFVEERVLTAWFALWRGGLEPAA